MSYVLSHYQQSAFELMRVSSLSQCCLSSSKLTLQFSETATRGHRSERQRLHVFSQRRTQRARERKTSAAPNPPRAGAQSFHFASKHNRLAGGGEKEGGVPYWSVAPPLFRSSYASTATDLSSGSLLLTRLF